MQNSTVPSFTQISETAPEVEILPNLIVASKPSGLPTTYRNTTDSSDCFMKRVSQQHPEIAGVKGHRSKDGGLIYRLDNNTSGIVLFARNQKSFDKLTEAQNDNRLAKYYYSICEVAGQAPTKLHTRQTSYEKQMLCEKQILQITAEEEYSAGPLPTSFREMLNCPELAADSTAGTAAEYSTITYPIGHSRKSSKKMIAILNKRYKSRGKPRPAITYFREICRQDNLILIEAIITKGIRHQIRIHLGTLGLKIAGDDLYNSKSQLRLSPHQMLLHCGKVILLKSPLHRT